MTQEEIEISMNKVDAYVEKNVNVHLYNWKIKNLGFIQIDVDTLQHIKNMCISMLNYKYNIGYEPGSFVKFVVDDSLSGAFGKADSINKKFIGFYVEFLYNAPPLWRI